MKLFNVLKFFPVLLIVIYACEPNRSRTDFDTWDIDGDGMVDINEFDDPLNETGFFQQWDQDGDLVLNENEWQNAVADYDFLKDNYQDEWDRNQDGLIQADEFARGVFEVGDENTDQGIAEDEFKVWSQDWFI